jgi:hypothetical protein
MWSRKGTPVLSFLLAGAVEVDGDADLRLVGVAGDFCGAGHVQGASAFRAFRNSGVFFRGADRHADAIGQQFVHFTQIFDQHPFQRTSVCAGALGVRHAQQQEIGARREHLTPGSAASAAASSAAFLVQRGGLLVQHLDVVEREFGRHLGQHIDVVGRAHLFELLQQRGAADM